MDWWYVPDMPVSAITIPRRLPGRCSKKVDSQAFQRDIEENGLRWPIVVQNIEGVRPNRIRIGHNRMAILHRLQWEHIPVLVWGSTDFPAEGPFTTDEVNERFVPEGRIYFTPLGPDLTEYEGLDVEFPRRAQ